MTELNRIQDRITKLKGDAAKARRMGRHGMAWGIEQTIKGLWAEYQQKAEALKAVAA